MKRYKVTLEVQGEWIAGDMRLNKENLESMIKHDLSATFAMSHSFNRDIDTKLEKLEIAKIKVRLPF